MRYKFLFSIFVFFFISVFIALGSWQIIRLNWKLELINQIETSLKDYPVNLTSGVEKNYLKIKTNGSIDFEKQIYLYNLNEKGKPGDSRQRARGENEPTRGLGADANNTAV